MLPELSGLDVCRLIRKESNVPIVMVTAKDSEADKVAGLELGADDYVTKPFNPRALVARVKAILRRTDATARRGRPIEVGALRIDPRRREATVNGRDLGLRAREFDLLAALARDPGVVLTRDMLLENVWGTDFPGETSAIDWSRLVASRSPTRRPTAPVPRPTEPHASQPHRAGHRGLRVAGGRAVAGDRGHDVRRPPGPPRRRNVELPGRHRPDLRGPPPRGGGRWRGPSGRQSDPCRGRRQRRHDPHARCRRPSRRRRCPRPGADGRDHDPGGDADRRHGRSSSRPSIVRMPPRSATSAGRYRS